MNRPVVQIHRLPNRRQEGISLLLVLILLVIMIAASGYFHNSLVNSTRLSGASRNSSASFLLAESAMEMLRGGFISSLDSRPEGNGSNCPPPDSVDKCEAYTLASNKSDATAINADLASAGMSYVFYSGVTGIVRTTPSILQSVADGSATASDGTFCTMESRQITAGCKLKINDLFNGATYSPKLYTTNSNGLLVTSGQASWDAELARTDRNDDQPPTVAAAWIEATANLDPETGDPTDGVDLWVQAAGQVGIATSYVQRYIGTYYLGSTVGVLAALIEASDIDRREGP